MITCKKLLFLFSLSVGSTLFAQNIPNPVILNVADAGAMKYNGKYYVGGVRTDGDFYVSTDLVHWGTPIHAVTMNNDWTRGTGAGNNQIHANDMLYLNGDFHLYWSVNYWGKDRHAVHIVHAQSKDALGPYTEPDQSTWLDNRIDPKVFKDDDGQLYMYMVRFTDGNTIWGRKMKNPAEFAGEPVCQFASLPATWETMDNRVAEGPWVMKYRNKYYMMYNANHTSTEWGNYQLGVAESDSPLGFQHGNKYSYPLVGNNQTQLEENFVDLLRYNGTSYKPLFQYTEANPSANWLGSEYKAADWKEGEAGFSSEEIKGSTMRHLGTRWTSPSLWTRKSFLADKATGNLALRIAHDGDTKVYLNGNVIYDKQGADYCIVNLDKKQRALLKNGENVLAIETKKGKSNFLDASLFDMKQGIADEILMTPGQPNILRGPNGFEWWLIYMANKNNEGRSQYIDRVQFFDKTMFVDGITGPKTTGYHPNPSLPTFSQIDESSSLGVLNQANPAISYLFETGIKTQNEAGVIAWWKDADNNVKVGLDAKSNSWYLSTTLDGKQNKETFPLPQDFKWGVYHQLRVERDADCIKIMLDEIPAPQKDCFTNLIPPTEPGLPGTFDVGQGALFSGVTYTIGFDRDEEKIPANSEMLLGESLNDYEFSFQLYGLSTQHAAGYYPIYVDKNNYVKAMLNGANHSLDFTAVKKGKTVWTKSYTLERQQTIFPDVKYTDNIEKGYRFASPTWLNTLYVSRHEAGNKSDFVNDMFGKFSISYLSDGKWYPIEATEAGVAEHPAYNSLSIKPIKAEGLRFINKEPQDLQHHIYKIGIQEQLKESYNIRTVRRGDKLYIFVDGNELSAVPDVSYPASRVGLCSDNYSPIYKGLMYYHIRN